MARDFKLPSGATLTVYEAPFSEAYSLYQKCVNELAHYKLELAKGGLTFEKLKDLFCIACASDEIINAAWPCLRRCLYAGVKIDPSTFEPSEARQDFLPCMVEIMKDNVLPLLKGLFTLWGINWSLQIASLPTLKKPAANAKKNSSSTSA
jgi:hypothetical protein